MSVKKLLDKLDNLDLATERLRDMLETHGTSVVYEVEFVGGSRPVDTPHISPGDEALELLAMFARIENDPALQEAITNIEEAEARYDDEYAEARRDLDLGPGRY